MQTMLLDQGEWDVVLDASGNWAVASDPYSVAQDVASAIRTFYQEVYYDTTLGINYFGLILGKNPSLQLIKSQFVAAALTVPQVVSAVCFISSIQGRDVSGQVLISYTTTATETEAAGLGEIPIYFVGANGGLVTFVGDNGGVVQFVGLI